MTDEKVLTSKKEIPTFSGRLYTYEHERGLAGSWVRRAEVDSLLDEIERLRAALATVYKLAGGHATECQCRQCEIFEFLEPIVGNASPAFSGDSSAPMCPWHGSVRHADCDDCPSNTPSVVETFSKLPADCKHERADLKCSDCGIDFRGVSHTDSLSRARAVAERIFSSAQATCASANSVLVHRQLIGELRAALTADGSSEETGKDGCKHDLLKPDTTIEVIDPWKAKCKVCVTFFDLPGNNAFGEVPGETDLSHLDAGVPDGIRPTTLDPTRSWAEQMNASAEKAQRIGARIPRDIGLRGPDDDGVTAPCEELFSQKASGDPYKATCEGGSGGPCTQPDCEKCWPDEPPENASALQEEPCGKAKRVFGYCTLTRGHEGECTPDVDQSPSVI